MRKRIYEIIEKAEENDFASNVYDYFMIVVILISLIPLAFKNDTAVLNILDEITVSIFIIDYLLRLMTADIKYGQKGVIPFIKYPFSTMAVIDLLSILPSLPLVNKGFKLLRILRMIRALRVIRVFKVMRYSKSFEIIGRVLKSSKESLVAVCVLASSYIVISALIIYNVEPDSFNTFFDAIYWATVSLTTVGYGDIYPISTFGRIVTMVSSIFGIAIVALPAGIITAGYMSEIDKTNDEKVNEFEYGGAMKGGQASSIGFVLFDTDLNSEQNAVFGKIVDDEKIIELGNKDALIDKMVAADSVNSSEDAAAKITLILFAVYLILLVLLFFRHQNLAQLFSGIVFFIGSYVPLLGLILTISPRYKDDEDMVQMRRYHACEHKAINMGKRENTLENMRKASMYEAECGTVYFGYGLFYVVCLSIAILNFSSLGFVKLLILMVVLAAALFINIFNPLNPFKLLQKPMIAIPKDAEMMLGLEMRKRLYSNDQPK